MAVLADIVNRTWKAFAIVPAFHQGRTAAMITKPLNQLRSHTMLGVGVALQTLKG